MSQREHAFTLIELLIVMSIIIALAGLILATSGYVQNKGYRSRAEAEIAAMSAALESYKADNGIYPVFSGATGSGHALYQALTGDGDDAIGGTTPSQGAAPAGAKSYLTLRANMVTPATPSSSARVTDPWKSDYRYLSPGSNNPTYDLWSTCNSVDAAQWIKNW